MYKHTATVEFTGSFPIDMLRYDRCYPASEESSITMGVRASEPTTVKIASLSNEKEPRWTLGRWSSFMAQLTPGQSYKI